jgi:hypothetical protein
MSSWSKFLAPVTVSTGGWAWAYSTSGGGPYTATIPAGTYDTYLHMMSTLDGLMEADVGANNAVILVNTNSAKTSVRTAGTTLLVDFDNCNDALLSSMGFDETESPVASTITANHVHQWAWYPGLLSLPSTGGVGLEDDSGNDAQETSVMTVSGSGKGRGVGPARDIYERTLRFSPIRTTEYNDKNRGPIAFKDRWKNQVLWWYFDREKSDVSSYSTQVDPGYPNWESDDDGAYVKCYVRRTQFTRTTSTPRWRTVTVTFNVEPK